MKKFLGLAKSRRSLLLVSAFAPICFGALLVGVGPSQPQGWKQSRLQSSAQKDIKIINEATSLDLTHQTTADNHLLIRVKNVSVKNLNGYVIEVNGTRITNDISSGDRVISSGQTDELEIPFNGPLTSLTVFAAMYADGSIEGDPVVVAELREWRSGLKKQLSRALSALDVTLNSPDVNSAMALDRLESQLSLQGDSVTVEPVSGRKNRDAMRANGAQDAEDTLDINIQTLRERLQRHGGSKQRERLLDLKARIERRIASL